MSEEEIRKCSGSTNISVSRETLQAVLRRPLSPSTPLRKSKKISDLSLELESELSLNKKINAWNNNNILQVPIPMAPLIVNPMAKAGGPGTLVSEESYSDSNSSVATVVKNPAPPGVFKKPAPKPAPIPIGPAKKGPVGAKSAPAAVVGPKPGPKGPAPIGPKPGPGPQPAAQPAVAPATATGPKAGPTPTTEVNPKTPATNLPTNPATGSKGPVRPAKPSPGTNLASDVLRESISVVPGTEDALGTGDGPGQKKKGKTSKSSKTKGSSDTTAYPLEVDVTASYDNDTSTSGSSSDKTSSGETKKHKDKDQKDNGELCLSKGMGAISFKVPGKITHKTTIKIAHYPQPGCEIVNKGCTEPYDCEELVIHENGAPGGSCNPCNPVPPCPPKPACVPVPPCEPACFPLPPGNYANNCNYYTLAENAKQQQQQQQQQQQYQMYQQQQQGMYNPYYANYGGYCYR